MPTEFQSNIYRWLQPPYYFDMFKRLLCKVKQDKDVTIKSLMIGCQRLTPISNSSTTNSVPANERSKRFKQIHPDINWLYIKCHFKHF